MDEAALDAQSSHLEHGGMVVRLDSDPPAPLTEVVVEIKAPLGRAEISARVVAVTPDGGVALALDDIEDARRRLAPLTSRPKPDNVMLQLQRMTTAQKQELAKYGDRMQRMALIRDTNKAIHPLVLRNRNITADEVRVIAGSRTINPDALNRIAQSKEWTRDQRIVTALVSNPKTPSQVAMRLLDRLSLGELRRLAKASDTPRAIQRAARSKLGAR